VSVKTLNPGEMKNIIHHLKSWSVITDVFTLIPSELHEVLGPRLTDFMRQLITLEILPTRLGQSTIVNELLYLALNLLHLNSKGILLDTSDMGLSESRPNHQRIWACRRLQAFHIGLQSCKRSGQQGSMIVLHTSRISTFNSPIYI
jgi:hypothetical protein